MADFFFFYRFQQQIEKLENKPEWAGEAEEESSLAWALAPGGFVAQANTPQDYSGGFIASSPCQQGSPVDNLVLTSPPSKISEADLSVSSEQESGIADVSFNSQLSEEGTRGPDPDDAAYSAA